MERETSDCSLFTGARQANLTSRIITLVLDADIREWFRELQACVRAVDFAGGRTLCAPDIVAFGLFIYGLSGLTGNGRHSSIDETIRSTRRCERFRAL